MMNATVEVRLFKGYKVGFTTSVHISHLQFGNDMLLLREKVGQMFEQ